MPEAHAIDIEKCTECPFISEHTRDDMEAACTHPALQAFHKLEVYVFARPPHSCPLRHKMTLLRVTS